MNATELLEELKRCFVALEVTDEMPRDVCPADMVHLIDEFLERTT